MLFRSASTVSGVTPGVKTAGKDATPAKAAPAESKQDRADFIKDRDARQDRRCRVCAKTLINPRALVNGVCSVCRSK